MLAGIVAGLAACGGASAPGGTAGLALEVNGWQLSTQDFLDELGQIAGNQPYVDARTSDNGGQPYLLFKPGTTDPDPNAAAELLNERVSFRLVSNELQSRNLTITDADRDQAISLIGQSLLRAQSRAAATTGTSPSTTASTPPTTPPPGDASGTATTAPVDDDATRLGRQILDGFHGSYQQTLLDGVAGTLVLQRALADPNDPQVKAAYDQQKDEACVSHILAEAGTNVGQTDPQTGKPIVPSDADYQAALLKITGIRAQLVGGADFATVAKASSDDTGSKAAGGDLGCQAKGAYEQSFDDAVWSAPLNELSAPVKTDFGYHLIIVREKRTVAFADFITQAQGQALQDFLAQAAQKATVVLAPGLGTWDSKSGSVQAVGTTSQLTLSPLDTSPGGIGLPPANDPNLGLPPAPASLLPADPGTTR